MKIIKLIILLIFIGFDSKAQDALSEYLQTAANNNAALKISFNEYLAALEVIPQVKALPDPQVAFGYFIMPVETRVGPQELKFSASQMFPWFGTLNSLENAAIQNAKSSFEQFEDKKSELYYNVRAAYYNLYYTKEAITITEENINILKTFEKLALIKIEAGLVSAVDEIRVEMNIADLENELLLLKDELHAQKVLFNNLLNVESTNEVIIEPLTLVSIDNKQSLLDSILLRNHQLKKLDFQHESLTYREMATKKMGMPSFSLGLDYTMIGTSNGSFSGSDAFMFPKIGISIPLYRNKYKGMVNEVMYLKKAKTAEKEDKTNVLESVFELAWKEYQDASRRVVLYKSQVVRAQKAISLLEAEYATNYTNFEEILRMERNVLKYRLAEKKAISDQLASIAFIYYLMGNK